MKRRSMKKILSQSILAILLPFAFSQAAYAKKCVHFSDYMNKNQGALLTDSFNLKGFTWSGRTLFALFVTPVSYSGTTVNVRIDRITRIWYADELAYYAIRQTNCRKFPCSDEKGERYQAPSPLRDNVGIGDIVNVDKFDSYKDMVEMDKRNKADGGCLFWNDKGYTLQLS